MSKVILSRKSSSKEHRFVFNHFVGFLVVIVSWSPGQQSFFKIFFFNIWCDNVNKNLEALGTISKFHSVARLRVEAWTAVKKTVRPERICKKQGEHNIRQPSFDQRQFFFKDLSVSPKIFNLFSHSFFKLFDAGPKILYCLIRQIFWLTAYFLYLTSANCTKLFF